METPMDKLLEQFNTLKADEFFLFFANNYFKLKKEEKQVIIEANEKGREVIADLIIDYINHSPEELDRRFCHGGYSLKDEAEQYYKELTNK